MLSRTRRWVGYGFLWPSFLSLYAFCTCHAAAMHSGSLPLVLPLNRTGNVGLFWSCGTDIHFTVCSTRGNISCTPGKFIVGVNSSVTAADVHYDESGLYYITGWSAVYHLRLLSGESQFLYQAPAGNRLLDLAVDWLNEELYLVEDQQILRCPLDMSSPCVSATAASDVREVSVDPNNGYLLWTTGSGGVYRSTQLLAEGPSATVAPPSALATAQSADPGGGFSVISQNGIVYVFFSSQNPGNGTHHPGIATAVLNRTGSVGPVMIAYTDHNSSAASAQRSRNNHGGLVCSDNTTCMWMEADGWLRIADLGRNTSRSVSLAAVDYVPSNYSCAALALWRRDLQRVPVPMMPPKNVEVLFGSTTALVSWEPPALALPILTNVIGSWGSSSSSRRSSSWYESPWRRWMYRVLARPATEASPVPGQSTISYPPPEARSCIVPSRGSTRCNVDGLDPRWTYNVTVCAYSRAGDGPAVTVRGSPLQDDSAEAILVTDRTYSLLRISDGKQSRAAASLTSLDSSDSSARLPIADVTSASDGTIFLVLKDRNLYSISDRQTTPRTARCSLSAKALAIAWDWVGSSLYVATESSIVRGAQGCDSSAEEVVSESASMLAVEPVGARVLMWIAADRKALKLCPLGHSCSTNVTTIYTPTRCQSATGRECEGSIVWGMALNFDESAVYWSVLTTSGVKLYVTSLFRLNAYRELTVAAPHSSPHFAVLGSKMLCIVNGTRIQVRDVRGDASGYYLSTNRLDGVWMMHNYSRWLLPGFRSLDAMTAAARPASLISRADVSLQGVWNNFTIRWPCLNTSALIDIRYNVTVTGPGISQFVVSVINPFIVLASSSIAPLTPLLVTVVPYTAWVTGQSFTANIMSPMEVPSRPEGLQCYVDLEFQDTVLNIYWDQPITSSAPVYNSTVYIAESVNGTAGTLFQVVSYAVVMQRASYSLGSKQPSEYFITIASCNSAGCGTTAAPLRVSTRVNESRPLPQVAIAQTVWRQVQIGDFKFTLANTTNMANGNEVHNIAVVVGHKEVSVVWIDSVGCIYQKVSEARGTENKVICGLSLPAVLAVDSSQRRLYVLQNNSAVVQVDLLAMSKSTVYQSAEGSTILSLAFHEQYRKLYALTHSLNVIQVLPKTDIQQTLHASIVKRNSDSTCNCTISPRSRRRCVLDASSAEHAAVVYYLEEGAIWRSDVSACLCWRLAHVDALGIPDFDPDSISAGGNRVYAFNKHGSTLASFDASGGTPFVLRNITVDFVWPFSSLNGRRPAPAPALELAAQTASEVRVTWRYPYSSATDIQETTSGSALSVTLLVWPLQARSASPLAKLTSRTLSSPSFFVSSLSPATTYSMQVWVCGDGLSCSFSAVADVTTLHAPEAPALARATNESLTFTWTSPADNSVRSHYLKLTIVSQGVTTSTAVVATRAATRYEMSVHSLQPATMYSASIIVMYRASSKEYQWPLDGVTVATQCSPLGGVAFTSVLCSGSPVTNCTLRLSMADPGTSEKCYTSFNVSISCLDSDSDRSSSETLMSSAQQAFVITASDFPSLGHGERCMAMAHAVGPQGAGPWSSPVMLKIVPSNTLHSDDGRPASELAAGLSVGLFGGIAVILVVTWYFTKRCRERRSTLKNRARREDRRSPEGAGQRLEDSVQLVMLNREPGFDMLANSAYQTESVLQQSSPSNNDNVLPQLSRWCLKLLRPIGAGAFGEVHAGTAAVITEQGAEHTVQVAIKTLRNTATAAEKSEFLKEAALMNQFHHEHVVQMIGVCTDADPLYLVTELMDEGDLLSYIRQKRPTREAPGKLSLHTLLHISLDIASGCEYLESLRFVHRDLAARNCLVSSNGHAADSCPLVKIGDFGLARDIYRNDYYRKEGEALLPVRWMAPESLVDGVFTNQSDVWSFGVVMWEVFSLGMQPYAARSNIEVLYFVRNAGTLDRPLRCPLPMFSLMSQCWSYVPKERPSFKVVKSAVHSQLSQADNDSSWAAAYDKCNGRLTSDAEFFSNGSTSDEGPLTARALRQMSDVFEAGEKAPSTQAGEGRVEYRSQNSIKGRLSKIFRKSANANLQNRVNSLTDPEQRKSNLYVRSDSVLSGDAVASSLLMGSLDGATCGNLSSTDEMQTGDFGDFILDTIAGNRKSEDCSSLSATHRHEAGGVTYSHVTVAKKKSTDIPKLAQTGPIIEDSPRKVSQPLATITAASSSLSDAGSDGSVLAHADMPVDKCSRGTDWRKAGHGFSDSADCAAVNYSQVVALPNSPKRVTDSSFRSGCGPHQPGSQKVLLAPRKSQPNSYAFDSHKKPSTVLTGATSRSHEELGLKAVDYSGCEPLTK